MTGALKANFVGNDSKVKCHLRDKTALAPQNGFDMHIYPPVLSTVVQVIDCWWCEQASGVLGSSPICVMAA